MGVSLQQVDNYKPELQHTTPEIFIRYMSIIQEFLVQCMDAIFISDYAYYRYIILKGIDTIAHVFRILLLYTNNLEITCHYSQKAFYYYVEFIGQIGEDTHTFLQLNSKDATLFVYKKTIYDVRKEFSNHMREGTNANTRVIMKNVATLFGIYNRCLETIFCSEQWDATTSSNLLKLVDRRMCRFTQNILNVSSGDEKVYHDAINMIAQLEEKISASDMNRITILEIFARKIKGREMSSNYLQKRIMHEQNDTFLEELTSLRYVNWLLADLEQSG